MKKSLISLALLLALLYAGLAAYKHLSPKAVLRNDSDQRFQQLVVELPTSRLVFGPIYPHSEQHIYFSRQEKAGLVRYRLERDDKAVAQGQLPYDGAGEWGRTLNFNIATDGSLSAEQAR
ncbi:hypothetical protein PVT67_16140 [Gallaecimonas kandeliae]|uniref:hypothetical protein n=1 Tax=Gallaecimonas kandeliae TaxID=3029055 RepID=UPI0026488B8D|nr:hypothetical protein [Gallaecimonas kandeliae]WKE65173.1 hypothetical protein PVT67_16140 [Gallaecimonas kandeliae]